MLIEAPCLLGEQFEHNKTWGNRGPHYLVGLSLFVWNCGLDGVTLCGSHSQNVEDMNFFSRDYLLDAPISFEIPDRFLFGSDGVPLRELGLKSDAMGWLHGLYLRQDGSWYYSVSRRGDIPERKERTEALDRLFSPILPAVRMTVADFL